MEESQSTVQIAGGEENGDAFYEQIEAPKFVDLNAPDHYHPGDDRYWFCSRVGCDQRHEQEMDPEEIYKNFVLRVMAARSPNIRLRNALYRHDSSLRCPQSVPAKHSKAKVSRLALISSISKRLVVDPKVKLKPISKPVTTPNVKVVKQPSAAAKARTTSGKRQQLGNPDVFRSVRNPKAATMASKSKIVAKALVFHSPKKSGREKTELELKTPIKALVEGMKKLDIGTGKKSRKGKTSLELQTPMRKLCEGMKKLEIGTGKKNVFGYRAEGLDASRKQLRGREVKSRVYDGLLPRNCKTQEGKTAKVSKKRIEDKSSHGQEGDQNNSTDMETEKKSTPCSLDVCSISKCAETELTSQPSSEGTPVDGNVQKFQVPLEESTAINKTSQEEIVELCLEKDSNDAELQGDETPAIASESDTREIDGKLLEGDENENGNVEKMKVSLEKESSENKESDGDKENEGSKAIESDDKENTSASDDNRDTNDRKTHNKMFGKHENTTQKVSRTMGKKPKDSSTATSTKPALTNPKPFRLRTDERRILKEANLENKPSIGPLREIKSCTRLPGERLQKKHKNAIQVQCRREKCLVGGENVDNHAEKGKHRNGTSILKSSKERTRRKISATPLRHTVSSQQKLVTPLQEHNLPKASQRLGNRLKKTKSPLVGQKIAKPRVVAPGQLEVSLEWMCRAAPGQLDVINETSPIISGHKEAAKQSENGTLLEPGVTNENSPIISGHKEAANQSENSTLLADKKNSASPASRPSSQKKKLTTIPKEPNFHTIHVPKSCTRRVA